MKLPSFIKQKEKIWSQFEQYLGNKTGIDVEVLADLYVEILEDLSYAKTFYPKSDIIPYLNNLANRAHRLLYRNRKESSNKIMNFYKRDFPLMFYKYRYYLLVSFSVFLLFTIIGWYSVYQDYDFVRAILGDSYVNMTLENIDKGDPMAVYKSDAAFNMFLGITLNNIFVAFQAFVYGIIFLIGTIYILMYNGVMLGSFLAFFDEHNLLWESFRTIWIHGTIEISVIVVAGAAGLVLGSGLLFPGTYSRLESLKRAGKDGVKILISTIPFFIVAGFLEGFVTRHTEMPDFLAIMIILFSLTLIMFYYVIYPVYLYKNRQNHKINE